LIKPMLLDFEDSHDVSDDEVQDNGKGKAKMEEEDLSKPFKEILKCPFTRRIVEFSSPGHRMPTNVKTYDGMGDLEDHIGRFVGAGNQGEWPMSVWCRMFQQTLDGKARAWFDKLPSGSIDNWGSLQEKFLNRFGMLKACDKDPIEISKITRKANETLAHFKEMWVSESNAIPNVPELMQVSSFMSSHKCPELAKRFSDNIPKTVDEMLKRVDDYLRSEEAYRNTELPRGEFQRRDAPVQWVQWNDQSQRFPHGNNRRRSEHRAVLTLDSLSITPQEILATEHQLKLPQSAPLVGEPSKENLNRQRGKGNQRNNGPQKAKVINMVQSHPLGRKRKTTMRDEKWMNVPITFPPVPARDLSEEPLVVEAEVEGYLLRAIPSTIHGIMKFPTPWGVATIASQAAMVLQCGSKRKKQAVELPEEVKRLNDTSPTKHVLINPAYPEQLVVIGKNFSPEGLAQLKSLLKRNNDILAWEPSDMTGVPKRIIKHSLHANPSVTPVRQKRRVFCSEKSWAITKEVAEWLSVGIVRPVKYPTWISNPVLVKKADGSWRMCIDFKNINSACPKDYYPLPEIDSKIEAVMGFLLKCFLDAYKGYHQVQMADEDEEKTAFYIDQDDMVVKSKTEREMLADIAETFDNLRRINMKLNPKKCSFRVMKGKFLGYMVTSEGIRANPAKTKDIAEMQSPRTWGEMQTLAGKLAALNRFLSRSAKKSLPFFETLRNITKVNKDDYRWTEEAEKAFQELKKTVLDLSALTTPQPKETLFAYLAASQDAASAVLLVIRQGKQRPMHYVSRTLHDAEWNYAPLEKLALVLRHASRRVRGYFEAHPITVITDQPIKNVLSKADTSGRLAPYSVELAAYNITYEPRSAVKGQILTRQTQYTVDLSRDSKEEWILYTDGAASAKGSGAGLVLISPTKIEYTYALRLNFESTNNQAEYEALLAGLRIAKKMGVQSLTVNVDSKLVASQINAFNHLTKEILVETLDIPSTDTEEINAMVEEEGETWMTPIINCLEKGIWPAEQNESHALRMKISQYVIEEGVLFKWSYLMPMLRCVGPLQANYVIREIHMGACGMHLKPRSVVAKAIRQGYYWPTMHRDAREEIRKCDSCQIHSPIPKLPKTLITSIMAPWPFFQWGMDVLGPLPEAPGKIKYGLPKIIVTDNGTNFVHDPFKSWCKKLNITQINTAVAHPQANGLVERANRSLMEGIKTRLGRERKGWVDELPNVLWAHRTSLKTSNGETPYSLTFKSEAVIPAEIGMPTHRTMMIKEGKGNKEELRLNLDLLTERREEAAIREA
ncbi:reverse transcriptase domain-containing protein, partial [Tanacetum coccineum]